MEYALFIAVVAAALTGMQGYVKRSIQANLKAIENQLNADALPPSASGNAQVANSGTPSSSGNPTTAGTSDTVQLQQTGTALANTTTATSTTTGESTSGSKLDVVLGVVSTRTQ